MIGNPQGLFAQVEAWHDVESLLLIDLRELLDGPLTSQNRRSLTGVLDRLLDSFPRVTQMKSERGYMSEVLDAFPNWNEPIDVLRRESIVCHCALEGLRDRVWHELPLADIALEVRTMLEQWVRSLQRIRRSENELLQSALNIDIGGEG